jgi:hypothetical protein
MIKAKRHTNSNLSDKTIGSLEDLDAGLEVIQRYVSLHGQTLGASHLKLFIENLQQHIKSGKIKKTHPYSAEIIQIQNQLVNAYNNLGKASIFKIEINSNRLARYKSIINKELNGLGFIPTLISAVAGKAMEYGVKKLIDKKPKKPELNGLDNPVRKSSLELAGFIRADKKTIKKAPGTFRLPGEIGKFFLDLQPYKLAISISGDPHSCKTEALMQLANAFADIGKVVAMFMLEQGGLESKDTSEAKDRNITPENMKRVHITGEADQGIDTLKQIAKSGSVQVIMLDSWQKLNIPSTRFDELRHEFPDIIWVVIFQQNGEGRTRGGVASDFDAPIQLKCRRPDQTTFKKNYIEVIKNRGNPGALNLKYLIFNRKTEPLINEQNIEKDAKKK